MWRDVFLNNKDAVLEVLGRFSEDLSALQRQIRWGDGDALFKLFTRTRAIRRGIVDAGQDSADVNFGRNAPKSKKTARSGDVSRAAPSSSAGSSPTLTCRRGIQSPRPACRPRLLPALAARSSSAAAMPPFGSPRTAAMVRILDQASDAGDLEVEQAAARSALSSSASAPLPDARSHVSS